jgi:hypothetical protein
VVLGGASIGKLLTIGRWLDLLIALVEATLAAALLAAPTIGVAIVVCALCFGYTAYAWTRDSGYKCRCFGARLPSTPRMGMIIRNTALSGLSIALLLLSFFSPAVVSHVREPIDFLAGVAVGMILLIGPWTFVWARNGRVSAA